jgi:hypothetical protein
LETITIEDIEARSTLKRVLGKSSVRIDSQTRAKRVTISLLPGCDEVRQILVLETSGVDFFFTFGNAARMKPYRASMVC